MTRKLYLIIVANIVTMSTFAQSISPIETTEICPNVNVTFTVTLPRIADNSTPNVASWTNTPILVSGVSNLTNTVTQTTFTYVGKFRDVNINQVFRVTYVTTTNPNAVQDFQFKRVKSFFYPTSCTPIQPNQTTITAPRCQISNFPISFSNVQWSTAFESPSICFGSITTYEYKLPANWSIGSNVSNGSNWIAGGNSVTITSDLATGDQQQILVRPSNSCAAGLVNGETPRTVNVSRPEPPLSISPTPVIICSGSANYTITGMPSGATVLWSINNTSDASISNITSPTVTLTRTSTANTVVTLTATVSHCVFTYTRTMKVALGTGFNTVNYTMQNVTCEGRRAYYYANVEEVLGATNYAWYAKDMSNPNNPFVLKESGFGYNHIDFPLGNGNRYYTVYVLVTTPCGNIQSNLGDGYFFAPSCTGTNRIAVSPNPTKNLVTIQLLDEAAKLETDKKIGVIEVQVTNKLGSTLLTRKVSSQLKIANIDISSLKSDIYFIKVWDGTNWRTSQFIKE